MRIETVKGAHLLCGHILPIRRILRGQTWASADGSGREVEVCDVNIEKDIVEYMWWEGNQMRSHVKESFAFQCRYCLVIDKD